MATIIQQRRDTSVNWAAANPILAQGEIGLDLTVGKFKLGDGSTAWNTLAFAQGGDGADGADGADGTNGTDGAAGADGIAGARWYSGNGTPSSSIGATGDYYLDGTSGNIWTRTPSQWVLSGENIMGPAGAAAVDLIPLANTWTALNTFTAGLESNAIQIDDGNDGGTLSLGALSGVGTMIKGYSVDHATLEDTLEFYTGNTARMSINSVGFVSIGSVLADESLVVGGDLKVNNSGTGSGNLHFGTTSDQTRIVGRDSSHGGVPDTMEFFTGSTKRCTLDASGALILAGSAAQKASGTTWSNPSDSRLKDNVVDYTKGSAELMQVRVCEWDYNGKGGTVAGMRGLGVIADEVMEVLPNTVTTYSSPMNPEDETAVDIKKFDATEITWLLVKTVQELTARIEQLENK